MITLVGCEKGGTGKTTIAINLAIMGAKEGLDVLAIDADKQPSASYFFQLRDKNELSPRITCIQKFGENFPQDVLDLSDRYDQIIIDAGGRDSLELRYAMGIADQIFIPLEPSQLDVWTLDQMDKLVQQSRTINTDLKAKVVFNSAPTNPGNVDTEIAKEMVADFDQLTLADTHVCERVVFKRSVREGRAVIEYKSPADPKAITEISRLYKEVFSNA